MSVVEYEITSNRVDCFGVVGIAREAAATFEKEILSTCCHRTGNDENVNDYVKVTVEDPELCPRYTARVVKNIKIGTITKWMQRRLASVRNPPDQQPCRYYKLCNGRIRTANACI